MLLLRKQWKLLQFYFLLFREVVHHFLEGIMSKTSSGVAHVRLISEAKQTAHLVMVNMQVCFIFNLCNLWVVSAYNCLDFILTCVYEFNIIVGILPKKALGKLASSIISDSWGREIISEKSITKSIFLMQICVMMLETLNRKKQAQDLHSLESLVLGKYLSTPFIYSK